MDKPSIKAGRDGSVAFNGPAAVDVYRISLLASSIGIWAKTGMVPTRGLSITKMLKLASQYTRKPYKRTEALTAQADLKALATMRAGIIREEC